MQRDGDTARDGAVILADEDLGQVFHLKQRASSILNVYGDSLPISRPS